MLLPLTQLASITAACCQKGCSLLVELQINLLCLCQPVPQRSMPPTFVDHSTPQKFCRHRCCGLQQDGD